MSEQESSTTSPLWRAELILTDECNFKCPYCRELRDDIKGELSFDQAMFTVSEWIKDGLKNVRFSGGEPTLYPGLDLLVKKCKAGGVENIAVSTNGSATPEIYDYLIECGVNDFSISLDGGCCSVGDKMAGGIPGAWDIVVSNIEYISKKTYVTVGMVFTEENINECFEAVKFAYDLGVSDIRVIPSAQYNQALTKLSELPVEILDTNPILKYRIENLNSDVPIRGIDAENKNKCRLVLDDMAVAGELHFPCIIYMREHGEPIGFVNADMREERREWMENHDPSTDPICSEMCLDVCQFYNRVANEFNPS